MHIRHWLFATALALGAATTLAMPAHAAPLGGISALGESKVPNADRLFQPVHARSYRHCHNMPRRTYCHAKERLPRNWPPNTNTPGSTRQPCWVNKKNCLF